MRVDPAETEPADGGPAGTAVCAGFPGPGFGQDAERARPVAWMRAHRGEVGRRRQRPVLEGQEDFQQAGRARGRQGVADVRLHRADGTLAGRPAPLAPEGAEALELDGVADGRAGRVALDQVDVAGVPPGAGVGRAHGAQLPLGTRGEQAAVHVVGQADRRQDAVDRVAVPQRVAQPLQDEHPRPLADDQAVGAGVERRRAAGARQGAELREPHLRVERVGARHPPGQHRVGAPGQKLVGRQLQGVERSGTRGVQRIRPAPQPQPPG
jgi:hypothetical protein